LATTSPTKAYWSAFARNARTAGANAAVTGKTLTTVSDMRR
jgi:hypothetical protein